MKLKFILPFFLLYFTKNYAQAIGNYSSKEKWKYIENENVKVIFTDSATVEAKRTADIIDFIQKNKTISIGKITKKVDLLINNNTTLSNGYTRVAPFKIEFYGTAFQNNNVLGSLNWIDGLAIHEYRHALQFTNFSPVFAYSLVPGGQLSWGAFMNLYVPDWFFEGDAVLAETLFSNSGRGRLPNFFEEQRALLLENKIYSYEKARNGSYVDLVPNHYRLGYSIINYGRNHFGDTIWSKVLTDAGAFKYFFYPFSKALKHHIGLTPPKMYQLAYKDLQSNWKNELDTTKLTPVETISPLTNKAVSFYTFSHYLDDGTILCIKKSFDRTEHLVSMKDGIETELTSIGINSESFLSVNANKVAWTELKKDLRRDGISYNQIIQFDLKSKTKKVFSKRGKYFSPQFSSNGDKIIAVKADENLNNSLVILENNSETIRTIPNPENDFLSFPKWSKDDKSIFYIAKRNSKIALIRLDLDTNLETNLTPWSSHTIGNFAIYENKIFFSASYSGINNIYCVDTFGSQKIVSITSVKVGADMPTISSDGKYLFFSELSIRGKQLKKLDLSNALLTEIKLTEPIDLERYEIKTTQIEHSILDSIPKNNYSIKPYNNFFKQVKFHSWNLFASPSNLAWDMWFDSILNDFSAYIGVNYNINEGKTGFSGTINYAKYFIPIQMSVLTTERSYYNSLGYNVNFKENLSGLAFSLPLSQLNGNYSQGLNVTTSITKITTSESQISDNYYGKYLNFNSVKLALSLYRIRQKALQNITNRWSNNFNLEFYKSFTKSTKAEKILFNFNQTLGGIGNNDVLEFQFKTIKEWNTNDYMYLDNFEHSRGYPISARDIETVFTTNYSFTLAYPDKGLYGILYCKRIIANLFCDQGILEINKHQIKKNSIGFESIFNLKIFNVLPISLGFRRAYLLNSDNYYGLNKYQNSVFLTSNF